MGEREGEGEREKERMSIDVQRIGRAGGCGDTERVSGGGERRGKKSKGRNRRRMRRMRGERGERGEVKGLE